MKKIETNIRIQASTEKIWQVVTDFEKYPEWNPFIIHIKADQMANTLAHVTIQPPSQKPMVFKPTIMVYHPNKELRWKGKLFVSGIFDGEHYFMLKPITNSETLFIHGEIFSGLLVPLFSNVLANTKLGFEQMNEALKIRSENS
jgi:hypothetical protein